VACSRRRSAHASQTHAQLPQQRQQQLLLGQGLALAEVAAALGRWQGSLLQCVSDSSSSGVVGMMKRTLMMMSARVMMMLSSSSRSGLLQVLAGLGRQAVLRPLLLWVLLAVGR
jgi:hypothetical protein